MVHKIVQHHLVFPALVAFTICSCQYLSDVNLHGFRPVIRRPTIARGPAAGGWARAPNGLFIQQPRIVGGWNSVENGWPFMALVRLKDDMVLDCAGSLIRADIILTAAHCPIMPKEHYQVELGVYNQHAINEETVQRFNVVDIVRHGRYNNVTSDNDIALLKLDRPASMSIAVNLVYLPRPRQGIFAGTICWIAGWGHTDDKNTTGQASILQEATVPIIAHKVCSKKYDPGELTKNMLCAAYPGKVDHCVADSGGPLVCVENGYWIQHGIVSWSDGCARKHFPGVYTRVANYVNWIFKKLRESVQIPA